MNEMIERVARAIALAQGDDLSTGNDQQRALAFWMVPARAAIEAMREPTEAIRQRIGWTYAILCAAERLPRDEDMSDWVEATLWREAIDEALK